MTLPTGESGLTIKLQLQGEDWVGTIDIPDQGIHRGALAEIKWDENKLSFRSDIAGIPVESQPKFELAEADGDLTGSVVQGPGSFIVNLKRTAEMAKIGKSQEPSWPLAYRSEDINVQVMMDSELAHELAGTLTLPNTEKFGDGPYPAVILLSGSGPQDRDESLMGHKPFLVLSDRLTKAGIAVLRCDDRGTGLSGGTFTGSTMAQRADDARASIEWLAAQDSIDAAKIGLLGHSEGGIIAPMVAAGEDKNDGVAFLVLLAGPSVPGGKVIAEQSAEMGRRSGQDEEKTEATRVNNLALFEAIGADGTEEQLNEVVARIVKAQRSDMPEQFQQGVIDAMIEQLNDPWLKHFVSFDPAVPLAQVNEPVLALFAELDVQVLPSQNEQPTRDALKDNPDATIEVIEGLNHLFQPAKTGLVDEYATSTVTMDEAVMAKIAAWINERFGNDND